MVSRVFLRWFDVALWLWWPSPFPEHIGYIQAPSAFTAIELVMQYHKLSYVPHAAAVACDGSIRYQAFKVKVLLCMEDDA